MKASSVSLLDTAKYLPITHETSQYPELSIIQSVFPCQHDLAFENQNCCACPADSYVVHLSSVQIWDEILALRCMQEVRAVNQNGSF